MESTNPGNNAAMREGRLDAADPALLRRIRDHVQTCYPMLRDGTVSDRKGGQRPAKLSMLTPNSHGARQSALPPVRSERLRRLLAAIDATARATREERLRFVGLPVHGRRAFFAWSLPQRVEAEARALLAGAETRAVVRFHDVTGVDPTPAQAIHAFEVSVDLDSGQAYIDFWSAGRTYLAELGVQLADGRLAVIARAEAMHLPRAEAGDGAQRAAAAPPRTWRAPAEAERFELEIEVLRVSKREADWPLRDLDAEGVVRAVYRRFLVEGPRIFAILARPEPIPADTCRARYEARMQGHEESESRTGERRLFVASLEETGHPDCRGDAVAPVLRRDGAKRDDISPEPARDDSNETGPALDRGARGGWTKSAVGEEPILAPVLARGARHGALQDRLAEALPGALSGHALRFEEALRAGRRQLTPVQVGHHAAAPAETAREPLAVLGVVPLSSSRKLARAVREAVLRLGPDSDAELLIRGRVKAGERIRIGQVVIETDGEGRFCVACVLRAGRLHVPVETVEAVTA